MIYRSSIDTWGREAHKPNTDCLRGTISIALPAVGRKLAAILAVDVVGYSRLMGTDEAGTHARLKALRHDLIEPAVAAHHGRTVKLMGDGALVEFASVVDAVQCAVAIQRSMAERKAETPQDRRIDLRIGVNLGDVTISTAMASMLRPAWSN